MVLHSSRHAVCQCSVKEKKNWKKICRLREKRRKEKRGAITGVFHLIFPSNMSARSSVYPSTNGWREKCNDWATWKLISSPQFHRIAVVVPHASPPPNAYARFCRPEARYLKRVREWRHSTKPCYTGPPSGDRCVDLAAREMARRVPPSVWQNFRGW